MSIRDWAIAYPVDYSANLQLTDTLGELDEALS